MATFIGITGTHSTGKSTFLEEATRVLEAKEFRVARVGDKATDCRKAGFPILRDHTFESSLWIMTSVIRGELEAERGADVVLVDRPVVDAIGYLEAALDCQRRNITVSERAYLYDLAKMHSVRYRLIFKTTLDESIKLGEGRDPDLAYRKLVDVKIARTLQKLSISHNLLSQVTRDNAIRQILAALDSA